LTTAENTANQTNWVNEIKSDVKQTFILSVIRNKPSSVAVFIDATNGGFSKESIHFSVVKGTEGKNVLSVDAGSAEVSLLVKDATNKNEQFRQSQTLKSGA